MKKNKLWAAFIGLTIAFNVNAQDKLLLSKRDYNDSENYKFTLEDFNTSTGAETLFHEVGDYKTSYLPDYLTYVPNAKKIVGIVNGSTKKLVVINTINSSETVLEIAQTGVWYDGLIVAEGQVLVIKNIYSTETDPEKYCLMSLDISTGTETLVHEFQTSLDQLRGVTYLPSTKQVVIVRGMSNKAITYNIDTKVETTFNLDQTSGSGYRDIVSGNGKVYLLKSTYNSESSVSEYNLVELDLVNQSEHKIHQFTKEASYNGSLAYLPKTGDVFALMYSGKNNLIQYNIASDTEVKITTLASDGIDYSNLIVIPEETATAVTDEVFAKSVNVYPNPAKDILSFSKTINSIKIYNSQSVLLLSGENTQSVDVSSLNSGLYVVDFDGRKEKVVIAK